ncbi:AimR family lysis-lysogeny pheromone receptor [Bacillus sp. SM2101]|uniref:AimR family lysis-lysogeny pheromone receptor n=1 Tax=Bacillus sp. SM2101 TaxID=2805366 RepID=UPI001BDEA2E1|nr:AimR family lysis-lysogeny pheromone receptor [Bacillus sp. SM2101]
MPTFKETISNEIEAQGRGCKTKMANIANYKQAGGLTKVLSDESREFDNFFGLTKLVQELFPNKDEEKELICKYARSIEPTKKTARYMLEYLEVNQLKSEKRALIQRMINCNNATSREWGKLYQIDDRYVNGKYDYLEALKKFDELKDKCFEVHIIKTIFKAYCYLDKKKYEIAFDIVAILNDEDFYKIGEKYIRDIYYARFLLIKAEYYVRMNNLQLARDVCNKINEEIQEPLFKTWAYIHQGNSHMFEDFDKANRYLQRAFYMSQDGLEILQINVERSMAFLDNLWNKQPRYLNLKSSHPTDIHDVVHYYINNKQNRKAMELLESEPINKLTDNERGFHYYLKGLITKDIEDFCESVKAFRNSGDTYFRKLPILELEKLNVEACIINLLSIS